MRKKPVYKLACVLLAAGKSTRFGSPKQLAKVNGTPLILHSLAALNQVAYDKYIVLGAHKRQVAQQLSDRAERVHIIMSENWQDGLSSSIKAAVQALEANYSHILFSLADQVCLDHEDFDRLIGESKCNQERIVCAHYLEKNAVPAIFPKHSFSSLMGLSGDTGAKQILAQDGVLSIPMMNAQWDIDTPQQLKQFNERH